MKIEPWLERNICSLLAKLVEDAKEAEQLLRRAIALVEEERQAAVGMQHRQHILASNQGLFELLIGNLVKRRNSDVTPEAILQVVEQGRSRVLRDLLLLRKDEAAPAGEVPEDPAILEARHRLATLRSQLGNPASFLTHDERRRLEQAYEDSRAAVARIEEERFQGLQNLGAAPPSEISSSGLVRDGEAIVVFRVLDRNTYAFLLTPDGEIEMLLLGSARDFLQFSLVKNYLPAYEAWRNEVAASGDQLDVEHPVFQEWLALLDEKLGEVYERLLREVIERVEEYSGDPPPGKSAITRLVIVPSGPLTIFPLHAAWRLGANNRKRYLIEDYVISYAPSLSIWRDLEDDEPVRELVPIVAGVHPDDPMGAELDAQIVKDAFPGAREEWGITRSRLREIASLATLLHLPVHGEHRFDDPNASYLDLAGENEVLTVTEILDHFKFATHLLVLAACETGLNDPNNVADEAFGIYLAALVRGARAVWSTLWKIQSEGPHQELMEIAYRELANGNFEDRAAALRTAQLEILKDFRARAAKEGDGNGTSPHTHLFYWAPYFCTGR